MDEFCIYLLLLLEESRLRRLFVDIYYFSVIFFARLSTNDLMFLLYFLLYLQNEIIIDIFNTKYWPNQY